MPHWFVTGASGFIGRSLCRVLVDQGNIVSGLFRSPAADAAPGVRIVRGDVADANSYATALADVDYVMHLAGNPKFGNGAHYFKENTESTATLLSAVRENARALRRFVLVSTIGAVDRPSGDRCYKPLTEESECRPSSDYGRSKQEAERLMEESSLPYSIVRPAMVVGAHMRSNSHFAVFLRAALQGSMFSRLAWPGRLSVIDVDDLVAALIVAATHEGAQGRTFFAAGDPVAIYEAFELAAPEAWRFPLAAPAALLRLVARVLPFALKVLLYPALAADDRQLRSLGWKPAVSGLEALAPVLRRERARITGGVTGGGLTIVTGAASGLGAAVAERLASLGRRLVLIDRDREGLERTLAGRENVRRIVSDLADDADLNALLASPLFSADRVDELYACAGFGLRGMVWTLSRDRQIATFKVNTLARMAMAHALLPGMIARQFGRIVFISSSSAFQPLPTMTVYAASNAAVLFVGEGLASEVSDQGVEVLTVCPGGMRTNFQKAAGVKENAGEKLMTPEEVAQQLLSAIGGNYVTLFVSLRSKAMSLLARLLPRRVSLALWRRLMVKLR